MKLDVLMIPAKIFQSLNAGQDILHWFKLDVGNYQAPQSPVIPLPELGISGESEVTAISACPSNQAGAGRVILGAGSWEAGLGARGAGCGALRWVRENGRVVDYSLRL